MPKRKYTVGNMQVRNDKVSLSIRKIRAARLIYFNNAGASLPPDGNRNVNKVLLLIGFDIKKDRSKNLTIS